MFLISFKLTDIFSINKQTTIIIIINQTQAKICFCFSKVHAKILLCSTNEIFNPIQDGLFRDCSRMGEGGRAFWPTLRKICHTNPTMMKLGTVISYLRKIQRMYKSSDTPLEFFLLASAFFHRKSANFATSRNTYIDWNLIDNF